MPVAAESNRQSWWSEAPSNEENSCPSETGGPIIPNQQEIQLSSWAHVRYPIATCTLGGRERDPREPHYNLPF